MKMNIGTSPLDAQGSKRAAERLGARDGSKNFPPYTPDGDPTADYRKAAYDSEAATTDSLSKATRFDQSRVDDDRDVAELTASTAHLTSDTGDGRIAVTQARARLVGFVQALPFNALTVALPMWLKLPLIVLLGGASGAATVAALQSATEDTEWLSYAIGAGVACSAVFGAVSIGRMLRERDLNDTKGEHFGAISRRSTGVLIIGIIGVLCLALGVASLRAKASEADAYRRASDTQVTAIGVTASDVEDGTPEPSSVPWTIWLLLETGLVTSALTIEYLTSNVRVEERNRLRAIEAGEEDEYQHRKSQLHRSAGKLKAAIDARADRDAAVELAGASQHLWANTQTAVYRGSDLVERGTGGDPFPADLEDSAATADAFGAVTAKLLGGFVGAELDVLVNGREPISLAKVDNPDPADPRHVLRQAMRELTSAPEHPELARPDRPHTPGDETVLDPAAAAKADALLRREATRTRAENPASEPTNGPTSPHVAANGIAPIIRTTNGGQQ